MAVAPHVGAWIETRVLIRLGRTTLVAPCAGAWIETGYRMDVGGCFWNDEDIEVLNPLWLCKEIAGKIKRM